MGAWRAALGAAERSARTAAPAPSPLLARDPASRRRLDAAALAQPAHSIKRRLRRPCAWNPILLINTYATLCLRALSLEAKARSRARAHTHRATRRPAGMAQEDDMGPEDMSVDLVMEVNRKR